MSFRSPESWKQALLLFQGAKFSGDTDKASKAAGDQGVAHPPRVGGEGAGGGRVAAS